MRTTLFATVFITALAACSGDDDEPPPMSTPDAPGPGETTLYQRLGAEPGIRAVITDFVGRVVADPKINGYFLNSSVNGSRLVDCLVKQVGSATGGPEVYDCRSMSESHAGLGAYAGALAAWPQLDEAVGLTLTTRPLARERPIPELD